MSFKKFVLWFVVAAAVVALFRAGNVDLTQVVNIVWGAIGAGADIIVSLWQAISGTSGTAAPA